MILLNRCEGVVYVSLFWGINYGNKNGGNKGT